MLILDMIIINLVLRSLLNETVLDQIFEGFRELMGKTLEHTIGEAAYNSIRSVLSKIPKKLFGDRIWKEVSNIAEEVFIYALGHEIYEKIDRIFRDARNKDELIALLKNEGISNPEIIDEMKSNPYGIKMSLGKEKYSKMSDKLKNVKSKDEFFEILKQEGIDPERFFAELASKAPDGVKRKLRKEFFADVIFLVYEETKDVKEISDEIKKEIEQISKEYENLKNLSETFRSRNLYVPYELYIHTPWMRTLLEEFNKYKFVDRHINGRDAFEFIEDFLNDGKDVLIVSGEGGCGKTRLAIELAERIKDEWNVYFVSGYEHFILSEFDNKSLLIVDDATRNLRVSLESIVGLKAKKIILDRPYNIDSIKAKLSERAEFEVVSLEQRDVYKLLENLGIEDEEVKEEIVKKSGGVFFYAILLAEFFKKEGIVDLEKALDSRIWKYIDEISKRLGIDAGDVKSILQIISLIMPVGEDDLDKIGREKREKIESLMEDAASFKGLLTLEDLKLKIFPDPITDYLRFEWFKDRNFDSNAVMNDSLFNKFLKHMPFRLSANLWGIVGVVASKYYAGKVDEARMLESKYLELMNSIFEKLNQKEFDVGNAVEYFSAMVFFTGNLRRVIKLEASLKKWNDVFKKNKNGDVAVEFAKALYNSALDYAKNNKPKEMQECVDRLEGLVDEAKEDERLIDKVGDVVVWFAGALYNSALYYGENNKLKEMQECVDKIEELYKDYPAFVAELFTRATLLLSKTAINSKSAEMLIKAWKYIYIYKSLEIYKTGKYENFIKKIERNVEMSLTSKVNDNPEVVDKIIKILGDDAIVLLNEMHDKVSRRRAKKKIIEVMKELR